MPKERKDQLLKEIDGKILRFALDDLYPKYMNAALPRVIVAPLTSKGQPLGGRPEVTVAGKKARTLLYQMRSVDKIRLTGKIGEIDHALWLQSCWRCWPELWERIG